MSGLTQLNELSRKTLAKYIQIASIDKSNQAAEIGGQNALGYENGRPRDSDFEKAQHKHRNRSLGINRAADKLAKESIGELQQSFCDEFQIELDDDEAKLILEDIILFGNLSETSPPGWEHVVKKLLQKGSTINPWAIAWSMKNKGYHVHPEHQISRKSYERWYKTKGKALAGYA